MAKHPTSVVIRSYQMGFGDCFLLSFHYSQRDHRHVLIDFGSMELPRGKHAQHMKAVAEAIRTVVGPKGRLTAVVATHRHADHISGFATDSRTGGSGTIIRDLRPRLVLQPWTEDPRARPNARRANTTTVPGTHKGFVASLAVMNEIAASAHTLAVQKHPWMSAALRKELSFLGQDNIANRSAIENLIAMGAQGDARARYLKYGDKTGLERWLPGVKVHVLGPPDLTQSDSIRRQRSKDRDQFWHFARGVMVDGQLRPERSAKRARQGPIPPEARWFRNRLQSMSGQGMLEIVRQLDDQMNNTSLILLFEVNGKRLLFPGDAQLENWLYALTEAKDAKKVQALLAQVDVYKVGHHGSLNATPRKLLWETFKKRQTGKLRTLLSTLSGKHGKTQNRTEVPRRTLVSALRAESHLIDTRALPAADLAHVIEL